MESKTSNSQVNASYGSKMKDFRCKKCHKLLMRVGKGVEFREPYEKIRTSGLNYDTRIAKAEVKCSKCKTINTFEISDVEFCSLKS